MIGSKCFLAIIAFCLVNANVVFAGERAGKPKGYSIPLIDLAGETHRQVIVDKEQGQYRVRLMDNHKAADCAYPGLELLPDGTFVTTTYGHWIEGESPFIMSVRFKLEEIDAKARSKNSKENLR